jgi:hypothetical protein
MVRNSKKMGWAVHVACMEAITNAHTILIGKLERKRSRGRLRCRWENNIRLNLREIKWEGMDLGVGLYLHSPNTSSWCDA